MPNAENQAGSDDVLVGFTFPWDSPVIADMTEQWSAESNSIVAVMSQSGGTA